MENYNVAFIPVRKGSKSIHLKNIKNFGHKPLLFWVLDTLISANSFNQIWVATDCLTTEELVKTTYGKVKVFRRSAQSATDKAPTIDVVLEFLQSHYFLKKKKMLTAF